MLYAVLSDIHSNLEAFSRVLERIDALDVARIICLGDIVGYNAAPNECVNIIKKLSITSVAGNHDEAASSGAAPYNLNPMAEEAILWTRKELSEENRDFLKGLPLDIEVDGRFTAVHSPRKTENNYIRSKSAAEAVFDMMRKTGESVSYSTPSLTFFGHTHIRCVYAEKDKKISEKEPKETLILEKGARYLINPGSVGQPRGGDPRASFLTFDSESCEIYFYLVDYDTEKAAEKVRTAGLPELLAKRLSLGQ